MVRSVLVLMLLGVACVAGNADEPRDALPLRDYRMWQKFEGAIEQYGEGNVVAAFRRRGEAVFFISVHEKGEAEEWWTFAVPAGEYRVPEIVVETENGEYVTSEIVFVAFAQRELVYPPVVADPEYFESVSYDGDRRVVAFARFPTPPQGSLVKWTCKEAIP